MSDCRGCKIQGGCAHENHGDYMRKGKMMRCPCRDCLVKMVCQQMCHELRAYKVVACDYWNMPRTYIPTENDNIIRQEVDL